jgi:Zn-dependent membrane protease YugP
MLIFPIVFAVILALSMWGRRRFRSIYEEERFHLLSNRRTGAELARKILAVRGIENVEVVKGRGLLMDFYDPDRKRLSLAPQHYGGATFTAHGIAANLAGHAIQDHEGHRPLQWRVSAIRSTVYLSVPLLFLAAVALLLGGAKTIFPALLMIWCMVVIANLATIPTELDARQLVSLLIPELGATGAAFPIGDGETSAGRRVELDSGQLGFSAPEIKQKMSLRASVTSELVLDDVRLPGSAVLPAVTGLSGPLSCLNEARFGIVFGALGAARDCLEATIGYAREREIFDKPLAGFQLTQAMLADMTLELGKGMLLALHLGRLKDAGRLSSDQVSLGKLNNVREAIEIARTCRTILGANGITLEYPVLRHGNNLESVLTYEGTSEVHQLVIGQAVTGESAFR